MNGTRLQATSGYALAHSNDRHAVSCDEGGPALGPIRLLEKRSTGLAPYPVEVLNSVLGRVFGRTLDCADLAVALGTIATNINDGNLARAMIGTQLLHLPVLGEVEARRAAMVVAFAKASPDDPDHPGWPKGTDGGIGGEFRPKEADGAGSVKPVKREILRRIQRRAIRIALSRMLSPRRGIRLIAEAASNVIPILDALGDAAMAEDIVELAAEFKELKIDTAAATDFAVGGPRPLGNLRMSMEDESFSSYSGFTKEDLAKRYGSAGDGYEYHHIVEQSAEGDLPTSEIQSTRNIVRIPRYFHEEINSEYGKPISKEPGAPSFRASLKGKTFDERYQAGLAVMRDVGLIQ